MTVTGSFRTFSAAQESPSPGIHARQRGAPGLSADDLQVARRQVTLKPPTTSITLERKRPLPADGGLDHFVGAGCYSAAIRSACAVRSMM